MGGAIGTAFSAARDVAVAALDVILTRLGDVKQSAIDMIAKIEADPNWGTRITAPPPTGSASAPTGGSRGPIGGIPVPTGGWQEGVYYNATGGLWTNEAISYWLQYGMWRKYNSSTGNVNLVDYIGLAKGTDYVPRTAPYMLHQGEAVVPAKENKGRGDTIIFAPVVSAIDGADVSKAMRETLLPEFVSMLETNTRNARVRINRALGVYV